jgi:carbamoylphosphate synthase large subunit
LPEYEKIQQCFDKVQTNALAATCGIPGPLTWQPTSVDEVHSMLPDLRFPTVIKRLSEIGAFTTTYAEDEAQVLAAFRPWLTGRTGGHTMPVLQQRIVGPGEGIFAL